MRASASKAGMEDDRIALLRAPRPETNKGRNPGSPFFIRGVLHITPSDKRASIAEGIAALIGDSGRILLVETAFEGDPLDYLEYVGGGHGRIPTLVRPLVRAGIPPPRRFARPDLDRTFPADSWPRLASGTIEMGVIDQDGQRPFLPIPAFFAVLRHVADGDSESGNPPGH